MLRALAANPWSALTRGGRFACNQWINRRDLARAVVLAGTGADLQHELCNVAGPELFSARDLLVAMARILRQEPWMHLPISEAERTPIYGHRYDMTRARARLGFAPHVKLDVGVGEVLEAMSPRPEITRAPRGLDSRSPLAEVELF
jgi:nucleoside-diphosphate-sugar epimerase